MGALFSAGEGAALYELLAQDSPDIVFRTDAQGFLLHATRGIVRLGVDLAGQLIGPRITDLVHPRFIEGKCGVVLAALRGRNDRSWIEFPARGADGKPHWFDLQLCPLMDRKGRHRGAMGLLRCINDLRRVEDELFAAEMTDSLTGLTNRKAFIAMLDHLAVERCRGSLAIFDIDNFRGLNLRFGQAAGDEVLVAFADLLRSFMSAQDILSRIGGNRFAVLMPEAGPEAAEEACRQIVDVLTQIDRSGGPGAFSFTASMGVARIGATLDETMKRAELALVYARAKGRGRVASHETSLPVRRHAQRLRAVPAQRITPSRRSA